MVLMLCFLCTLSSYSNDKLPQLEVKQRKGNMLVKLHNYNDTTSLVCLIQGSGNNLEADFDPEKVLKVSGTLLNRGAATISIRTKETDEVILSKINKKESFSLCISNNISYLCPKFTLITILKSTKN